MAQKLVSLDIAPQYSDSDSEYNNCPYLYLNKEQCEALGIDSPAPGSTISLLITAEVQTANLSQGDDDGEVDTSLSLCVTQGAIVSGETGNAAKKLYGND